MDTNIRLKKLPVEYKPRLRVTIRGGAFLFIPVGERPQEYQAMSLDIADKAIKFFGKTFDHQVTVDITRLDLNAKICKTLCGKVKTPVKYFPTFSELFGRMFSNLGGI